MPVDPLGILKPQNNTQVVEQENNDPFGILKKKSGTNTGGISSNGTSKNLSNTQSDFEKTINNYNNTHQPVSKNASLGYDVGMLPKGANGAQIITAKEKADDDKLTDAAVNTFNKTIGKGAYTPKDSADYVNQLKQGVKNGDLTIVPDAEGKDKITNSGNFFQSFKAAADQAYANALENNYIRNLPKDKAIQYLNDKAAHPEAFEYKNIYAPEGISGFAGSQTQFLGKATIGTLAGAETGLTGGASIGSFLSIAKDLANAGYSESLQKNYNILKQQGLSDDEAFDKATKAGLVGEAATLGQGALLSGEIPLKGTSSEGTLLGKLTPNQETYQGFENSMTHTLKSAPKIAGSTAAISLANDITTNSIANGNPIDGKQMLQNVIESEKPMLTMHFVLGGLAAIANGQKTIVPSYSRPQMENVAASMDRSSVENYYRNGEQAGIFPEGTTDKVLNKLTEFDNHKQIIENLPISEERKSAITGKLIQRDNLKQNADELSKYGASFNDQIENINKQVENKESEINALVGGAPIEHVEQDELTGDRLSKAKSFDKLSAVEKDGIEVPKEYGESSTTQVESGEEKKYKPKAVFFTRKGGLNIPTEIEIGDKSYTDKTKAQEIAEKALSKHYYENELHDSLKPQLTENSKSDNSINEENGVTVIKPSENTPNENITTINSPENNKDAIPIEKTNEMDVRQQTTNGEGVGARNAEPEITTRKEEEKQIVNTEKENAVLDDLADIHVQYPKTQLSHGGTEKLRTEFGGEETPKKERESMLETERQADEAIKDGYNVDGLLNKMETENHNPTPKEQFILTKHADLLANQLRDIDKSKGINSPEFDAKLNEIERVSRLSDLSGSRQGKELSARRFSTVNDDSLTGFLLQEKELNKGADLTQQQKTQAINEYEKINSANDEFKKKYEDLQEKYSKLKAERELKKTSSNTKKNIKKTHEDFTKERKEIYSSIKDKLKQARQETNVTIVPYAKELIAIAPDVAKLAKSLIEEGVTKLEDVVKNIHAQLKEELPDIQEKDVHDIIAGNYNEKKKTRSQVAEQMQNLKIQAQLINKLEALENGETPKNEKAKVKRNQEIQDLQEKVKTHGLSKLADIKSRNEAELKKVQEQLNSGDFSKPEKKQLLQDEQLKKDFPKEWQEAYEARKKLIKAKEEREYRMLKQEYDQRSKYKKASDQLARVLNIPRTIMASFDYSAPLRQAVTATTSHPIMAAKAFGESVKQSFSQERFDNWFHDLKETPRYDVMQESKLAITDPHNLRLQAQEEAFMGNLAEKIPVVGRFIKGSERAYVSYLNKMRVDLFNRFADEFEEQGRTINNSPELYKGLASYINNSTGRGELGVFESSAPILNSFLFAPRLIASRFNMLLNPVYYAKLPKEVRVEALKDMAKFVALGTTVLALAKLNGASVEDDPRSSDFGKIKSGNTRWDIWGGFQPYARVLTQFATGQRKSATTGDIYDLDGEGAFGKTRLDPLMTFGRGKLSPVAGMAVDLISGRDIAGNKVTWGSETVQHFTPLLYSDISDAFKDRGVKSFWQIGIPSTFGIGVNTYQPKPVSTKKPSREASRPKRQHRENQ